MAILIYHVCLYIVQFAHKFKRIVVSQLENGVYPDQWAFNCVTWVEYTINSNILMFKLLGDIWYLDTIFRHNLRRKKAGERVHNKEIQNHVC